MADGQDNEIRINSVMDDPSARAVARVYATALVDAAATAGVGETLEELASFLDDVLTVHPEFHSILIGMAVGRDQKVALIERVVGPVGSPILTSFLSTLARHERLDLIPLVLDEARLIEDQRAGRKVVQVSSSHPLDDETLESIRVELESAFSFTPILETRVDAKLIGGLVIQVENTVYDSSLRTRIKQLRDRLRERSLHEIQGGRDRFSHPAGD
jgi:F-type H+-transporting ATPase subunit delta